MEARDDKKLILYSQLEKHVTVGLILKWIHLWNPCNANYIWNKREIGPSDNYTAFFRRKIISLTENSEEAWYYNIYVCDKSTLRTAMSYEAENKSQLMSKYVLIHTITSLSYTFAFHLWKINFL